jgi:hypothetical protein
MSELPSKLRGKTNGLVTMGLFGEAELMLNAATEIERLTALVSKYEAAIDEHEEAVRNDALLNEMEPVAYDKKLWQTREKV